MLTLHYTVEGGSGTFTCLIDTSDGAPTPYEQVKAALGRAGFAGDIPDDFAFQVAINERFSVNALSDRAAAQPAQITNALEDITSRQAQIANQQLAIDADLAALNNATLAQVRGSVGRLLAREQAALNAEDRILQVLSRALRALRRLV